MCEEGCWEGRDECTDALGGGSADEDGYCQTSQYYVGGCCEGGDGNADEYGCVSVDKDAGVKGIESVMMEVAEEEEMKSASQFKGESTVQLKIVA